MQHRTTAVDFPTQMRAHVALACRDIERSRAFYQQLLGIEPTKVRAGYVKFEVLEPPLNLTLNYAVDPPRQSLPAHFGVQVKSTADVLERRALMHAAGFESRSEEGVDCCFAIQDKVWFLDPDGNNWEVFVVTQADTQAVGPPAAQDATRSCCAPSCCT